MRHNRLLLLLSLVLASTICISIPGFTLGVKYRTSGAYVDGQGGQHQWNVNDAHTLIWDNNPYIPVGCVFTSKYLSNQSTEEDYQVDVKALESIKAGGVTDIILKSGGPITSTRPESLQKIIDYLNANGFAYGIEMDDGPKEGLRGCLVSPNRYRLEGPSDKTTIICNWPNVDSAIFVVVSKYDNAIRAKGGAVVKDGKVTVILSEPLTKDEILIVYPHITYKPESEGGIGDIWSGFGEYRDRVLAYFKGIKFGTGLRFFLESYTNNMDFNGEMVGFLPDSSGFRLGLEAYLNRKYKHEGGVNAAWAFNENLDNIETAARVIPMWISGRGVAYAYDRASAQMFPVDTAASRIWQDINDYRDNSIQEYMNTIADTIHKQVANVPVIFKSSSYARIYANPFGMGGFDGLGVQAYGTGDAPVISTVGPVYSLAEESGKATWFIAADMKPDAAASGYSSLSSLTGTLENLREIGCKGFFVDNIQSSSEQLAWIKSFRDKISKAGCAEFKPDVIYYPNEPDTGAYVKRLARETWWLPTLGRGKTTYIGDGLFAYTILGEDRTYMWSGIGDKTITINQGAMGAPSIDFPNDAKLVMKKGIFSVDLNDNPTVLRGLDINRAFPNETAEFEINRLTQLIPEADKSGLDVKKARGSLESARSVFKNNQSLISYGMAKEAIITLLDILGRDQWVEGELSAAQNFGQVTAMPGASSGLALVINTDNDAPLAPYTASYRFDTKTNSSYEIWVAGTTPSEGSALSWRIDDGVWTPLSSVDNKSIGYAADLAWYKIGAVNLFPSNHTITLRVDGRRSQDNRYYFAIDALVLSPRGFMPNGIIRSY